MERLSFLVKEYNFKFDKIDFGDIRDENEKLWLCGPFNCYSFYNKNVYINFMNLVHRQEWYITITRELLASVIKNDIENNGKIFGNSI